MKPKLIIITGPTAVGKTDISIKSAQKLNGEIISCDSMQIYKYMDIGSAKVTKKEMDSVPHHMIDIIDPRESFSVAEFKEKALSLINDIHKRGKVPILAGGTGLYIDSIICNYDFTEANKDYEYRNYLQQVSEEKGKEYLFDKLQKVDAVTASKLHPNNVKRVIRALEVYKITGKPFSEFEIEEDAKYNIPFDLSYFVLTMDRGKLYERINLRVDAMIKAGLIDEVKMLKEMGCTEAMQSMKGIGYKELLQYLDGKISLDDSIEMIKKGSRNYAKRQLTWFRKDSRSLWIDKDIYNDNEIIDRICKKNLNKEQKLKKDF